MDEDQKTLGSPIAGGLRGIRRSISSNVLTGRGSLVGGGDNISANLITNNSLALGSVSNQLTSVNQQVTSINASLTAIKDNLALNDEIERKRQREKERREAILAEQGLREGKESQLEKRIQFALLSPVRRVANFTKGILTRLGDFLLILAGGWLTEKALQFIKLTSDKNIEGLKKFKERLLKDLLFIGGIVLATTVAFGKIFALTKLLGALALKITLAGALTQAFLGLGSFITFNVRRFIDILTGGMGNISGGPDQGVGFLDVLFYGSYLLPILRPIKNFLSKALGKMPGGGMLRNFYSSSMSGGKGVQNLLGVKNVKSIKWPQGAKFLKRFRLIAITLSLFNDSMSMIAAGFKPYQAILVAIARTAAKLGMFAAYSVLVSQVLGGVFAGVGAIAGAIAGGVGGPPGAIAGGLAGATKGYAIGTAIGPYLAFLSLLFPDQVAKIPGLGVIGSGGRFDPMAIEENIDRTVTNQTSKLIGVNDETRENYMTNEFSSNKDLEKVTTTDSELISANLTDNIVPFKTNMNGDNLEVDSNLVNVIDTTLNNKKNKSNFVGSGKEIANNTPNINSTNKLNSYKNDISAITGLKLSAL